MSSDRDPVYSTWVVDYRWHRDRGGVRFVWFGDDPFRLAAAYTGGQVEHSTLADLRRLHASWLELGDFTLGIQRGLGRVANDLHQITARPVSDEVVADELQMSLIEYRLARHLASFAREDQCVNAATTRIYTEIWPKLYFRNPLILAFELRKIWDMYVAAGDVLSDTIHDLARELVGGVYTDDICRAVGLPSGRDNVLSEWLQCHAQERGAAGDPRRRPTTMPASKRIFTDPRTELTTPPSLALARAL